MKDISLEYANLPVGQTRNGTCPSCGERKFYVTRQSAAGWAYICFRASCGLKGYAGTSRIPVANDFLKARPAQHKGSPYTGELFSPQEDDIEYFWERFGVELGEYPGYWVKVAADQRYAFPLWGPKDEYRGVCLRRPCWSGEPAAPRPDLKATADHRPEAEYPKALNYLEPGARRAGWYHSIDESTVVLVEDCVSGMRIASEGLTSMCLLGTNFTMDHLRDLQQFKNMKRCIIALDPDATGKALEIAHKWGPAFPGMVRVAVLDCDPKDYVNSKRLLEDLRV